MPEIVFSDKESLYLLLIQVGVYLSQHESLLNLSKEMILNNSEKIAELGKNFNDIKEDLKSFLEDINSIQENISDNCDRIYIDGCWDIMHSGHFNAIRQAKMLGKTLVVGIHSDEEIMRNKGISVMNNEERIAMIKACKWVDEVVENAPYSADIL